MNIVLTHDVRHLGYAGDVVSVATGYARNYLIPQGFAALANATDMKRAEEVRKNRIRKQEELLEKFEAIAEELKSAHITLSRKTSSGGKLFGGVSETDIAETLQQQKKIEVDRRYIILPNGHLKTTGEHEVKIVFSGEKQVSIIVSIQAE